MWETIGHDRAIRSLERAISGERLAHAYLFVGPARVGKMTLALDLARAVNCSSDDPPCSICRQCERIASGLHPDVRIIGLEPGRSGRMRTLISIDQVREVQREASLLPFEGRRRVFIFEGAERLTEEAANSLLKTLEEPPEGVLLVLLASDASAVLPTILSRCRRADLRPVPSQLVTKFLQGRRGVGEERALEIAGLASGRIGWAVEASDNPELLERVSHTLDTIESVTQGTLTDRFEYAERMANRFMKDRKPVLDELELWRWWWRDVLMTGERKEELVSNVRRRESLAALADEIPVEQVADAIRAVQRTSSLLERNVSPRLALESMALGMPLISG